MKLHIVRFTLSVTSSSSGPVIPASSLCSGTIDLCSFLRRETISRPIQNHAEFAKNANRIVPFHSRFSNVVTCVIQLRNYAISVRATLDCSNPGIPGSTSLGSQIYRHRPVRVVLCRRICRALHVATESSLCLRVIN
jgi:hypothetical protein